MDSSKKKGALPDEQAFSDKEVGEKAAPSATVPPTTTMPPMRGKFVQTQLDLLDCGECKPHEAVDQYYTQQVIAQMLYLAFCERYNPDDYWMFEPSAGKGAFFRLLPDGSAGVDVEPKCEGVLKRNFLNLRLISDFPICCVGNPPFGKNAKLAVKFFNHAARQSNLIAFILPKSFRKSSVVKQLDRYFHLVHDQELPEKAFEYQSKPYTVPTVFQIWQRGECARERDDGATSHPDFEFTTPQDADFALQRVGARAGRVHHNLAASRSSHYFIRGDVEHVMITLDFASVVSNTVGVPSLAQTEIVRLYREKIESLKAG